MTASERKINVKNALPVRIKYCYFLELEIEEISVLWSPRIVSRYVFCRWVQPVYLAALLSH